jgi:hypothetical protein
MSTFHSADKHTHRKVMFLGLLLCTVFVTVSFFARPQPENHYVLKKADRFIQTANTSVHVN